MSTTTIPVEADITRDLGSVLSGEEKRFLVWMAGRLPEPINSDHLTLLGFVGMVGAGASFWAAATEPLALFGVVFFLFVNWFGDSLDGTLARVRGCQRPKYGYYVDHVVDVFGAFFLLGGLALSGYMSPAPAFGLMVVYLMVVSEIYLAAYAVGTFRIHFLRLGPTELRILFSIGTLYLLVGSHTTLLGKQYLLFDVGGICAILGLFVTLLASVMRNTLHLYRAEPVSEPGKGR
ncbi:MAG TPA: CDP-alcohol phosphatidyltransferase family protein [Vicinamibacteria bacterium]|nr:CDP-alcohol phosphatidyltransferase family protein [Vicinamibacteria bacterium]